MNDCISDPTERDSNSEQHFTEQFIKRVSLKSKKTYPQVALSNTPSWILIQMLCTQMYQCTNCQSQLVITQLQRIRKSRINSH